MTYNYRGKTITIDDKIIAAYRQAWCGMGPSESTFDRYISCEYATEDIEAVIAAKSNEELSVLFAEWMQADIDGNR